MRGSWLSSTGWLGWGFHIPEFIDIDSKAPAAAGIAVYVYESGMWNPQPTQAVQDSQLPAH